MSGLSAASAERLAKLEAKAELAPMDRGVLRSMKHSKPSVGERERVERLLAASAPAQTEKLAPTGDAYERGRQRGMAAGGKAYTRGTG
jgi:hypothetical protein